MALDAEQLAAQVKGYIDGQLETLRGQWGAELVALQDGLMVHKGALEALDQRCLEQAELLTVLSGTPEFAERYRQFVVSEAASLGIKGSEILKAKKDKTDSEKITVWAEALVGEEPDVDAAS